MKRFRRKQAVLLILVLLMCLRTTGIYGAEEAFKAQTEAATEAEGTAEHEGSDTGNEVSKDVQTGDDSEISEKEAPCEESIVNTEDERETEGPAQSPEREGMPNLEKETEISIEYTDEAETCCTDEMETLGGPGRVPKETEAEEETEVVTEAIAEEEITPENNDTDEIEFEELSEATESESTESNTAPLDGEEPYYNVSTPKVTLRKVGDGIVGTAEIECLELRNFTEGMELKVMLGTDRNSISDGTEELELEIYSNIGGVFQRIRPGEKAGSFSDTHKESVRLKFILPSAPKVAGDFCGSVTFTYFIEDTERDMTESGYTDEEEEDIADDCRLGNGILENDLI